MKFCTVCKWTLPFFFQYIFFLIISNNFFFLLLGYQCFSALVQKLLQYFFSTSPIKLSIYAISKYITHMYESHFPLHSGLCHFRHSTPSCTLAAEAASLILMENWNWVTIATQENNSAWPLWHDVTHPRRICMCEHKYTLKQYIPEVLLEKMA